MTRKCLLTLALTGLSLTALAAPPGPKGKATPKPIPSEMPTFQNEHIAVGRMYLKKQDFHHAEQEFRSATLIDPTSVPAAVGLGDALYATKRYQEALDEFMRAMRMERPTFADVPLREASKLVAQHQLMAALHIYRQISHVDPKAGDLVNKAVACLQRGDKPGAKKALTDALKIDTTYTDAYFKLGKMAYDDKAYGDAIEQYEKAAKSDPEDGLIQFALGNAYYRFQTIAPKGDKYAFYRTWEKKARDAKWFAWCVNKAAADYRKANQLRPHDFDILYNLGVAEYYLKHYPAAIADLHQAELIRADDADAHTYLGNAWFQRARTIKEYNYAVHEYLVAQNLAPKRWELEYDLGQAYLQKSKLHPRSDEFEVTPANAKLYYAQGSAYFKTLMLQQAGEHFQKYLYYMPDAKNRPDVEKLVEMIKSESSRTVQGAHPPPPEKGKEGGGK